MPLFLSRVNSVVKLEELVENYDILQARFDSFMKECQEKSEICHYFRNFLKIVSVIKMAIIADRDGNWSLHVGAVGKSMSILAEFDAIN